MIRVFTKRGYRINFNTLPSENEDFLPSKSHLPFPLQLIISQKRQKQQYITNAIAYQFLSTLQVTFFANFFYVVTEILLERCFFVTTVKLNSQNNCINSFPFRRYKEKQVSLLAASRKDSIFSSQKNPIKCKALFPQWNLKTCKFYGVSNTEEQSDFPRKLIPCSF